MYALYTADTRTLVFDYDTLQDLIETTREIEDNAYLRGLVLYAPEGTIAGDDFVAMIRGEPVKWK